MRVEGKGLPVRGQKLGALTLNSSRPASIPQQINLSKDAYDAYSMQLDSFGGGTRALIQASPHRRYVLYRTDRSPPRD